MEKWVNTPYGSCKFLIARSFLYFIVLCLCLEPPIISLYSHQNGKFVQQFLGKCANMHM